MDLNKIPVTISFPGTGHNQWVTTQTKDDEGNIFNTRTFERKQETVTITRNIHVEDLFGKRNRKISAKQQEENIITHFWDLPEVNGGKTDITYSLGDPKW